MSKVSMDYSLMEEMAAAFAQGADQLENSAAEMKTIVGLIAEGGDEAALRGQGGSALEESIQSVLIPKINQIQAKFLELQQDVLTAMREMQEADTKSVGYLNS